MYEGCKGKCWECGWRERELFYSRKRRSSKVGRRKFENSDRLVILPSLIGWFGR